MRSYSTGLPSNTAPPHWRLAVHSVLLRGLEPHDAWSLVQTSGYDSVFCELTADAVPPPKPSGLEITCLAFEPDQSNPVDPSRAAELAEALGTRHLRVYGSPMAGRSYAQAYEATVRTCEAFSDAARKRGMRVLLHQRWGTVTASASQMLRVLEHFDPHDVGCIYDAGSMTIEGYEEYRIGLEILGSYVADVHIANTRHFPPTPQPSGQGSVWQWEWSPLSDGLLDLYRLMRALRRANYGGWVTLADRCAGPPASARLESGRRVLHQVIDDLEGVGSHNPVRALDDHVALDVRPQRFSRIPIGAGHRT